MTTQRTSPSSRFRGTLARRSPTLTGERFDRIGRAVAALAVAFGVLTLIAGGRILLGLGEAGYAVLRPVLIFNTVMGAAYVAAGVGLWRAARWGTGAAVAIAVVNLGVLLALASRRAGGATVADETMAAMTLRTAVWLALAVFVVATRRGGARQSSFVAR